MRVPCALALDVTRIVWCLAVMLDKRFDAIFSRKIKSAHEYPWYYNDLSYFFQETLVTYNQRKSYNHQQGISCDFIFNLISRDFFNIFCVLWFLQIFFRISGQCFSMYKDKNKKKESYIFFPVCVLGTDGRMSVRKRKLRSVTLRGFGKFTQILLVCFSKKLKWK